jgi:hypothetical protein
MISGETRKGRTGVHPGGGTPGRAQAVAGSGIFGASVRLCSDCIILREEANARAY